MITTETVRSVVVQLLISLGLRRRSNDIGSVVVELVSHRVIRIGLVGRGCLPYLRSNETEVTRVVTGMHTEEVVEYDGSCTEERQVFA